MKLKDFSKKNLRYDIKKNKANFILYQDNYAKIENFTFLYCLLKIVYNL